MRPFGVGAYTSAMKSRAAEECLASRPAWGRAARLALLALLACLGLAFSPGAYDPTLAKTTAAWFLIAGAWMGLAWQVQRGTARWPSLRWLDVWSCLALTAWMALAVVSPRPWFAWPALRDASLLWLVYWAVRLALTPADLPGVGRTLAAVTCLAGGAGLLQTLAPGWAGLSFTAPEGWPGRGMAATMGNPDYLACWLLVALPFAVSPAGAAPAGRLRRGALVAFILACLGLTLSRAAWLGLAVELALLGGLRAWVRRREAGLALAAAVLVLALTPGLSAKLWSSSTLLQRAAIWEGAVGMAAAQPFAGCGPGGFGAAFPAHRPAGYRATRLPHVNDFAHDLPLHAAAVGGLVGVLLLLGGLAALGLEAGPVEPRHVALVGILAQNLFSVTLCVTPLAVLAAFVAALPAGGAAPPGRRPGRWMAVPALLLALAAAGGGLSARADGQASALLREARRQMDLAGPVVAGEGAGSALDAAISLRPCWPSLRYRRAGLRAVGGELAGAAAGYVLLEALSPGYAELPANRAEVYLAMGRPEAAGRQARLWKDMNSADPASHVLAAKIAMARGDRAGALENALQARKLGGRSEVLDSMLRSLSSPPGLGSQDRSADSAE